MMADMDVMLAAPGKEFGIVTLTGELRPRAIGEMRLRRPMHRMIARVDPGHRRDRTELSDRGIR
jgi:hypothetical protein